MTLQPFRPLYQPRCGFCLRLGHVKQQCPELPARPAATEEPLATADDAMDQLRDRCIALTAYAGQLLREMRDAGLTPTASTLALNPDGARE